MELLGVRQRSQSLACRSTSLSLYESPCLTHYPRILYGWDQHHPVLAYHLHLLGALASCLNVHHVFEWRL